MILARPLTIAEIFDRTVTLTVQRWRPIAVLALLSAIPSMLSRAASHGQDPKGAALVLDLVCSLVVGAFTYSAFVNVFADEGQPRSIAYLLREAAHDFRRSLLAILLIDAAFFAPLFLLVFIVAAAYFIAHIAGAIVAGVVLGLPAVASPPAVFTILAIVYPMLILERTGPWATLRNAWRRAGRGGYARTWLLGASIAVAVETPAIALSVVLEQVAKMLGGLWWLAFPGVFVALMITTAFGSGLSTIAAIDYRLRAEGTDLHAALEMPAPA
jgi:hypothetical protein